MKRTRSSATSRKAPWLVLVFAVGIASQLPGLASAEEGRVVLRGLEGYPPGSAKIPPPWGPAILAQTATKLREHERDIQAVTIVGHTDAKERDPAALSLERADQVRIRLVEMGVPATKLRACGCGTSREIATNETKDGRAANRRVEMIVNAGSPCCGP